MTQIIYFTLDTNPTLDTLDTIYIYTPGGSAEGSQGPALARRVDLALGGGEAAGSEICKQMFRFSIARDSKKERTSFIWRAFFGITLSDLDINCPSHLSSKF